MSRAPVILFFLKLLGDFLAVIVLAVIFDTFDNLYVLGVKDFNICVVLRAELDFDKLLVQRFRLPHRARGCIQR